MLTLAILFFVISLLYSTVGFGGGTSYIAALSVSAISYVWIPKISLLCNLIVVTGGCYHYFKQGYFSKNLLMPFVLSSVPFAYLGGLYPIREKFYYLLLTGALLFCGVRILFIKDRETSLPKPPPFGIALLVGAFLGALSGMVGVGGGIFLSPILINLGWARSKNAAAVASAFILLNSVAGLAGQFTKNPVMPDVQTCLPLFAAVIIGGQIGSRMGTHSRVSHSLIQKSTGLLTLMIGGKLLMQAIAG
ncbi:MAG: sulfite exporter TauE/SafE family protein [Proteobacteria bacterium]|nr:MAG: sulfite exporter TauE/SafE family protein [Pseudomonadota bacterium]